jgi:membrane dipeptidase
VGLSGIAPFLGVHTRLVPQLLRQLRYVIELVGTEHVGLGLDYVFDLAELEDYVRDNPRLFPVGFEAGTGMSMVEPEAIGEVVEGLARDNLTDEQIQGILGRNWLRIAQQVWK